MAAFRQTIGTTKRVSSSFKKKKQISTVFSSEHDLPSPDKGVNPTTRFSFVFFFVFLPLDSIPAVTDDFTESDFAGSEGRGGGRQKKKKKPQKKRNKNTKNIVEN